MWNLKHAQFLLLSFAWAPHTFLISWLFFPQAGFDLRGDKGHITSPCGAKGLHSSFYQVGWLVLAFFVNLNSDTQILSSDPWHKGVVGDKNEKSRLLYSSGKNWRDLSDPQHSHTLSNNQLRPKLNRRHQKWCGCRHSVHLKVSSNYCHSAPLLWCGHITSVTMGLFWRTEQLTSTYIDNVHGTDQGPVLPQCLPTAPPPGSHQNPGHANNQVAAGLCHRIKWMYLELEHILIRIQTTTNDSCIRQVLTQTFIT